MITITSSSFKSFGSEDVTGEELPESTHQLSELVTKLMEKGTPDNRRPIPSYWDKDIKKQLAEYCEKAGIKLCEALEAAALLFMTLHPSDRVNLILNVIQVVQPSREQLSQVKEEIEQKLMGGTPTRLNSGKKEELLPVQCKCSPPKKKHYSESLYAGEIFIKCQDCNNPFMKIPPAILANTPHYTCKQHPNELIVAPMDDPPDCPKCHTEMQLIFQHPVDTSQIPKKPRKPPPRKDEAQTQVQLGAKLNANPTTTKKDSRPERLRSGSL